MAVIRFNKVVVGIDTPNPTGTTLNPADIVSGTGRIQITDYVSTNVTLNHLIHRVKLEEKGAASLRVWGNKESLATQLTEDSGGDHDTAEADMHNFGGTHEFYRVVGAGETLVASFDGLVDAEYNIETRQTKLTFKGEYHGVV